jgi:hypothetical protein
MFDNSSNTIEKILKYCDICHFKLDIKTKNCTEVNVLESYLDQLFMLRDIINICLDDFKYYTEEEGKDEKTNM